jgi:hypothetical protein
MAVLDGPRTPLPFAQIGNWEFLIGGFPLYCSRGAWRRPSASPPTPQAWAALTVRTRPTAAPAYPRVDDQRALAPRRPPPSWSPSPSTRIRPYRCIRERIRDPTCTSPSTTPQPPSVDRPPVRVGDPYRHLMCTPARRRPRVPGRCTQPALHHHQAGLPRLPPGLQRRCPPGGKRPARRGRRGHEGRVVVGGAGGGGG